ncbi:RPA-related protein RADX isoform X2 [Gouania willdenowi]|uniref:RPA-related protein RADX isoform X2 n=1 Tax=Gouania willdenowi TaxID=441366 RepID=UPI0010549B9E|nr:RPA-related protein RADX-like isoform X2 [Gouania willdenowi]
METQRCAFRKTLGWARNQDQDQDQDQDQVSLHCSDVLYVTDINRYTRDREGALYHPHTLLHGADLYDITLCDSSHCRLRASLDPSLNHLVERRLLLIGRRLHGATFSPSTNHRYRLLSVELRGGATDSLASPEEWAGLPWFGPEPTGPVLPLRANRSVFLPLWNSVDYSGTAWTQAPPTEEEEEEEDEGGSPTLSLSTLRHHFLSGRQGNVMRQQLIVRITDKSHLMYYGKPDRNCVCPYKAILQVCDSSDSVCVVLWNSVCVRWYCRLKVGDIISLRHFRVKQQFGAGPQSIEVSVNSCNPAAKISVLKKSSVSHRKPPPQETYHFYNSLQVGGGPPDTLCDVIGLLTFSGRPERIKSKDGKGEELVEYRWLRLEDGASNQPIMVKLFSTSQPDVHQRLRPLLVIVCSRMKIIRSPGSAPYLTNSTYSQVYCTGCGQHSQMSYRRLRPVRHFLCWLRKQDEAQVLRRALIGGFFTYPPPPTSLETYMTDRRGESGFLRGAELHTQLDQLCYRERGSFCIKATITMVTYRLVGEDTPHCWWREKSTHCRKLLKRKQLHTDTPKKKRPFFTQQHNQHSTAILFQTSMEFLLSADEDESVGVDDEDEADSSCSSAPLRPSVAPVAVETLPLRYDHSRGEEQAAAMALGGASSALEGFDSTHQGYYTLRLRVLSDGVMLDVTFLPSSSSSSLHANTWTSILAHGAFSTHTPPPSAGDLVAMAAQLANQSLVCVLEACHLGGACMELVLSRAYH